MFKEFHQFVEELKVKEEEYGPYDIFESEDETNDFIVGYDMGKMTLLFDEEKLLKYFFTEEEFENLTDEESAEWEEFASDYCISLNEFTVDDCDELDKKICDLGFDESNIHYFSEGKGSDYITACIGLDKKSGRVVYDYSLMIEYLMKIYEEDEKDEDERFSMAVEWIDFNTIRALPYFQNSPIIIDRQIVA